jgi:hypothetical protein
VCHNLFYTFRKNAHDRRPIAAPSPQRLFNGVARGDARSIPRLQISRPIRRSVSDRPLRSGQALENAQNGKGWLLAEVGMDLGSAPLSLASDPRFAQRPAALVGEDWLHDDAGDRVGENSPVNSIATANAPW